MNSQSRPRFTPFLLLVLVFVLLFPSLSLAARKTVSPLPLPFDPAALRNVCVHARILSYEPGGEESFGSLKIQLVVPEQYGKEDILSLKEGDFIKFQGKKLKITMVEQDDGDEFYAPDVHLDTEMDGTESENLWMIADRNGIYFCRVFEEDMTKTTKSIRVPYNPSLIFIDGFGEDASWERPAVRTGDEFLEIFSRTDPSSDESFANDVRISVCFDAYGNLVQISRGY